MLDRAAVVSYALAKPGAVLDEPWEGDEVAKVGGKIFAFFGRPRRPAELWLRCHDHDEVDEWRRRFPAQIGPPPYLRRHPWNRVVLEAPLTDDDVRELVDLSYETVVARLPRRLRPVAEQ